MSFSFLFFRDTIKYVVYHIYSIVLKDEDKKCSKIYNMITTEMGENDQDFR